MPFTVTQKVQLALLPGAAEALERSAIRNSNLAVDGVAKGVKIVRNGLYVGVAMVVIAATGAVFGDTTSRAVIVTLGAGVVARCGNRLQNIINSAF